MVEAHQEASMAITFSGIIKNERCFFTLFITKNKWRNKIKTHLYLVVHTHAQNIYTMEGFPFSITIKVRMPKNVQRPTRYEPIFLKQIHSFSKLFKLHCQFLWFSLLDFQVATWTFHSYMICVEKLYAHSNVALPRRYVTNYVLCLCRLISSCKG